MEQAKISPFQLFCLIFLFELGSAVIVGLGLEAKQDAWISVLIGLACGLILLGIYNVLYKNHPNLLLTSYPKQLLGRKFGSIIGYLYIVYFIYLGSRVLRDIATLLQITWLQETPTHIISILMIMVAVYTVFHGVEVLARTGEVHLFIYGLSIIIAVIFIFFSDILHLNKLMPVGENWSLILKTAFPTVTTFPFGEIIAFAMIFPYLNNQKKGMKYGFLAFIIGGLIIALSIAINITALGVNMVGRAPFPLLTTMGKVSLHFFVQRLDILACIILVIGGFFKITIFLYTATIGTADLFKIDHKKLALPMGTVFFLLSIMIASNAPEHFREGLKIVPTYIHLPMQVLIPILLLAVTLLKKQLAPRNIH